MCRLNVRFFLPLPVVTLLVLGGCSTPPSADTPEDTTDTGSTPETPGSATDEDGDGVSPDDGDCDDDDASVHPGLGETCNGVDDNCNGVVDEGLPDADADTIADCQDAETCDGLDNDGNGLVDEGFGDADGNGVADCVGVEECDGVDNNEDGRVDEGFDGDGDGYTSCGGALAADCDDTDPNIFPDAGEVGGDEVDNDCNGLIDEDEWLPGDLAINELLTNPADVLDPNGEWFEVVNMTDHALILNGLVLSSSIDAESHQVTASTLLILEPGDYFVFGANGNPATNGAVEVDYVYQDLVLSNETDELVISAAGVELDALSWDDGLTMPDVSGAAFGVDPARMGSPGNDLPESWCPATEPWGEGRGDFGTPGARNPPCAAVDHDGDGYSVVQGDCDDGDTAVYPGAPDGLGGSCA